jgi:hypothetical protein
MRQPSPQTTCNLCGNAGSDQAHQWWPSADGEICQDCWDAGDESITSHDIEELQQVINLLPEEFDIPASPFDLGSDFDHLGVECAEPPSI